MKNRIKIFNEIVRTHNQFKDDSELWKTIAVAYRDLNEPDPISKEDAIKIAHEYWLLKVYCIYQNLSLCQKIKYK